jgi:MFS family permease
MDRTIKLLMLSDIFFLTGFGLIDPILGIFIKEGLIGGTIFMAGIASTMFLITKCLIQLPFSRYVDKHDDKVKWLILGSILIAVVPFAYIFAKHIYAIFFLQILHGIGSGLAYPTWLGLWTVHLDKKHESFEWSLYSTFTGLGVACTAAIGAAVAQFIGFKYTFVLVGIMALVGCAVLFSLERRKYLTANNRIRQYHKKKE